MDHNKREEVINIVGGNTMAWMKDRQEEKEELYLCTCCGTFVPRNRWDPMLMVCKSCIDEGEE